MRIVIAGGTGFLGGALAETWAEDGHEVLVLSRSLKPGESRHESGTGVPGITRIGWMPDGQSGPWASSIEGAEAVVNLAGTSIGGKRWNAQRKAELRDSRVRATRSLAAAIAGAAAPPKAFISASGVDYYDSSNDEPKTEASPAGRSFLAQLCEEWEAEARRAARPGMRLITLRTGLVLERSGGVLPQMAFPYRFLAGGPVGSGRQYMSWIHRLDWIEIVRWIVVTPDISGPVNATAPQPVTNRHFARALGHALKRPALLPTPGFALRLAVGELADYILAGARVVPTRALAHGYHFRYPEIEMAFRGIYGD